MGTKVISPETTAVVGILGVIEGAVGLGALLTGLGAVTPESPLWSMLFMGLVLMGLPVLAYFFMSDDARHNKHRLKEKYQ